MAGLAHQRAWVAERGSALLSAVLEAFFDAVLPELEAPGEGHPLRATLDVKGNKKLDLKKLLK